MKYTTRLLPMLLALTLVLNTVTMVFAVDTAADIQGGSGGMVSDGYQLQEFPKEDYGKVTIFTEENIRLDFDQAIFLDREMYFCTWPDDEAVLVSEVYPTIFVLPDCRVTVTDDTTGEERRLEAYPYVAYSGQELGYDGWVYDGQPIGGIYLLSGNTMGDIFTQTEQAMIKAFGAEDNIGYALRAYGADFYIELSAVGTEKLECPVSLSSNIGADLLPQRTFSLRDWDTVLVEEEAPLEAVRVDNSRGGVLEYDRATGDYLGYYQTEKSLSIREFTPDYLYNFPANMELTLIPTMPEGNSLLQGRIILSAWSDTDGDKRYEQQICSVTYNDQKYPSLDWGSSSLGSIPVPLSEAGLFVGRIGNSVMEALSVNWLVGDGVLNSGIVLEPGFYYIPGPATITGEKLLQMFGPDTLVEIDIEAYDYEGVNIAEATTWHYHFYIPAQKPSTYTANPTNDALKVDGISQVPTIYKIGSSNYFQLRDVAMLLNGTKAQFNVEYDNTRKAVVITTGQPYKPLGTELTGAAAKSMEAILGNNDIYIDGVKTDFDVYKINGANFFQIRALGKVLGFNVGWSKADGMYIQSDRAYSDAD